MKRVHGKPGRPSAFTDAAVNARIVKMAEAGSSVREIAKAVGISKSSVGRYLRQLEAD